MSGSVEVNEIEKDYTVFRKKIYKGKVAPTGSLFLMIKKKTVGRSYTSCLLIKGGLGTENEALIAENMRNSIKKKYKV
jgi:hypothetical protein